MATKKPRGLGLGLEALLGPQAANASPGAGSAEGEPHVLPLDRLQAGRYQPRTRMDEGALYELAESIKAQGVMQPVLVRPLPSAPGGGPKRFEIIAGERRFRAAKLAGLDEVPVLVRDVSDEAAAAMALIENIQREDLNPLEEAHGLKRLVDEFGMTHDAAARAVGRSRSAASNLLRLLHLTEPVQQMLLAGDLEMGHARALLPLAGAEQILEANEVVARKLNVRETEQRVARRAQGALRQASAPRGIRQKAADMVRIEQQLADVLTAAVEIRVKKRTARGESGEIAIAFGSLDELNGLLGKLGHA